MKRKQLTIINQLGVAEVDLTIKAAVFNATCYGSKEEGDTNTHRYKLWKSNMAKSKVISALKSFPYIVNTKRKCTPNLKPSYLIKMFHS